MGEGDRIAAEALTWVGTPHVWQGRIKGVGVDCKGLVAGVARECGRPEAESVEALAGDYTRAVDERRLRAGLDRLFDRVAGGEVEAGDVLLLQLGGRAQHLAIAVSVGDMVHDYGRSRHARVMRAAIPHAKVDSVWRWKVLP